MCQQVNIEYEADFIIKNIHHLSLIRAKNISLFVFVKLKDYDIGHFFVCVYLEHCYGVKVLTSSQITALNQEQLKSQKRLYSKLLLKARTMGLPISSHFLRWK